MRKRVIKILRDICIEQPEYPKIPEICLKIIRRINDEEGIKVTNHQYYVACQVCDKCSATGIDKGLAKCQLIISWVIV